MELTETRMDEATIGAKINGGEPRNVAHVAGGHKKMERKVRGGSGWRESDVA